MAPIDHAAAKAEKKSKKEKKRAREEDAPVDTERKHKKSKSVAPADLPAPEVVNGDLKAEKKKKKSKKDKKSSSETANNNDNNDEAVPNGTEAGTAAADADSKADRHIVFVGNLPFTATADTIQAHFASLSPIHVRCMSDPADSKPCRGFAFVEFAKVWHMRTCLDKFHHSMFEDGVSPARHINVELT